jgi:uncharacterized hydrophobic protein (TIGR00271 family)
MKYSLNDLLDNFRLKSHRENYAAVIKTIEAGVVFRGTNLWVLIFAIFIASLGLNVNSPAVIIGAMLVSPLMGPIMGMGLAMGINDVPLLRKSLQNFGFAAGVSLITSTLFFLISPINEAHSELLARTSPNIYDVLIAFFGGLAGILATASKLKGNVIPGVAIATALMPPLCTAGYGIATWQPRFFVGALYLFIINTVFIALATLITVRFLHFPYREKPDTEQAKRAKRIITLVTIMTILPSIYLGYQIVLEARFMQQAARFIEHEASIPGDYLLQKQVNASNRSIVLTFGGKPIDQTQIAAMRSRLEIYGLAGTQLEVRQGFATDTEKKEQVSAEAQREASTRLSRRVLSEARTQFSGIIGITIEEGTEVTADENVQPHWIAVIRTSRVLSAAEKRRMREWLRIRLQVDSVSVLFIAPPR